MRKRRITQPDKFFDVATLVEAGPYCVKSIYRFIKTGQLKARRRGRRGKYVIKEKDWSNFLDGKI